MNESSLYLFSELLRCLDFYWLGLRSAITLVRLQTIYIQKIYIQFLFFIFVEQIVLNIIWIRTNYRNKTATTKERYIWNDKQHTKKLYLFWGYKNISFYFVSFSFLFNQKMMDTANFFILFWKRCVLVSLSVERI